MEVPTLARRADLAGLRLDGAVHDVGSDLGLHHRTEAIPRALTCQG